MGYSFNDFKNDLQGLLGGGGGGGGTPPPTTTTMTPQIGLDTPPPGARPLADNLPRIIDAAPKISIGGGGGGGDGSATDKIPLEYWSMLGPTLEKIFDQGINLYNQDQNQRPSVSPGTDAYLRGLMKRGTEGSSLVDESQSSLWKMIGGGYRNPGLDILDKYTNPRQNPATDMITRASGAVNPAMQGIKDVASGSQLGGNPYFEQVLNKSLDKIKSNYMDIAVPTIQGKFGLSGGYNRNAESDALAKARAEAGGLLSAATNQAYFGNYDRERGYQDTAQGRLGDLGQRSIENLFRGGQLIGDNYNTGQERGLRAGGMYSDVYGGDVNHILSAINAAPGIANQDYVDLKAIGEAGQGQDRIARDNKMWDWENLGRLNSLVTGRDPMGVPRAQQVPQEGMLDQILKGATIIGLLGGGI